MTEEQSDMLESFAVQEIRVQYTCCTAEHRGTACFHITAYTCRPLHAVCCTGCSVHLLGRAEGGLASADCQQVAGTLGTLHQNTKSELS